MPSIAIAAEDTKTVLAVTPADGLAPRWFAAHTRSRHEKKIAEQLASRDIEYFLPLYDAAHRWKDRVAHVQLPLFPGYIFVHVPVQQRLRVLEIAGVAGLVTFNGKPAPLPVCEIESLRNGLAARLKAEPLPYLTVGRRVRVKKGPLSGVEGILLRKKDALRIVISIDLIQRSVALEIDAADVDPLY